MNNGPSQKPKGDALMSYLARQIRILEKPERLQRIERFLWVAYPDCDNIAKHVTLSIDAASTEDIFLQDYPMFQRPNMTTFQKTLGRPFASYSKKTPVVHQTLAMMMHLISQHQRDVEMRSWDWFEPLLSSRENSGKDRANEIFTDRQHSWVLFWMPTVDPPPDTWEIFRNIEQIQDQRQTILRCFPSQSEARAKAGKIADIKCLEEIASYAPDKYSYRPRICLDHSSSEDHLKLCVLRDLGQYVQKRSFSCGGKHVRIQVGTNTVDTPKRPTEQYFHQEFVPSLIDCGEFRVYIVAQPALTGLRGRSGKVKLAILTRWREANSGAIDILDPSSKEWEMFSPFNSEDLESFALYIYSEIRQRQDWKDKFESLEIGVRLDIGVALIGKDTKRPFVLEITRFYSADYFSTMSLGSPFQRLSAVYAEALNEYFPK